MCSSLQGKNSKISVYKDVVGIIREIQGFKDSGIYEEGVSIIRKIRFDADPIKKYLRTSAMEKATFLEPYINWNP